MLKKLINFILPLIFVITLTSCYDTVELEKKEFVLTLGVDKFLDQNNNTKSFDLENNYSLTLSIPTKEDRIIKKSSGKTITSALSAAGNISSKTIDYRHVKVILINKNILEDANLLKELLDVLERNKQLSRKVIILATEGETDVVINQKIKESQIVGRYITDYYKKNKNNINSVYFMDLEKLLQSVDTNGTCTIPIISIENDEVVINSAYKIKDFNYLDTIDQKYNNGYGYFIGNFNDALLVTNLNENKVTLRVSKGKTKYNFYEKDNKLYLHLEIGCFGSIREYIYGESDILEQETLSILTKKYEKMIENDVHEIWNYFYNDLQVDGFNIYDMLRSKDYKLFEKYLENQNLDDALKNIQLEVTPSLKINSVGSIK